MAGQPLPDNPAALQVLLGQVDQFLRAVGPFADKLRMQQLMIRRVLDDPDYALANRSYAAHLQEEIYKSGAALEFPGGLSGRYLDEDGERSPAAAEDPPPDPAAGVSAATLDTYRQISAGVGELGELIARYERLARRILFKLASMPAEPSVSPIKFPAVVQEGAMAVDGVIFSPSEAESAFLGALEAAEGGWVSHGEMSVDFPVLKRVRLDRLVKKLPDGIREFIEAKSGKGYRFKVELLA